MEPILPSLSQFESLFWEAGVTMSSQSTITKGFIPSWHNVTYLEAFAAAWAYIK
jgi:hypothetical protein